MLIHGIQLFKNGCFNADPHAGNFMLLPDDRIGLIDYTIGRAAHIRFLEDHTIARSLASYFFKNK